MCPVGAQIAASYGRRNAAIAMLLADVPPDHDVHRRPRLAAFLADHVRRAQAVFIQPVAAGMLHIGFKEPPHHQRMRALAVVIHEKRLHGCSSRFIVPIDHRFVNR